MIIWLNGAFGAGKTTCAFELRRRLPGSFVYDPENIGYFIRKHVPQPLIKPDFQHYRQWRSFNYDMLKYIADSYEGVIIVPMTVTDRAYYDEMVQRLIDGGVTVKHYILYADRETIVKRLNKRLERGETWAKLQIDRCLHAFGQHITEEKIMTDNRSIDSIVEEIAARSGLALAADRRSRLRKWFDRVAVLIKHIR